MRKQAIRDDWLRFGGAVIAVVFYAAYLVVLAMAALYNAGWVSTLIMFDIVVAVGPLLVWAFGRPLRVALGGHNRGPLRKSVLPLGSLLFGIGLLVWHLLVVFVFSADPTDPSGLLLALPLFPLLLYGAVKLGDAGKHVASSKV